MKRIALIGAFLALSVGLAWVIIARNGGKDVDTQTMSWQEQYDLGVRLLGEGNYEEAILAFQAVLQIDPKQTDVYVKMAYIYLEMGEL